MDAAHSPYCAHSEPELVDTLSGESLLGASFFGDAQDYSDDINCYDAALRKVDEFLAAVFAVAERASTPTVVLYFSDHGEALEGITKSEVRGSLLKAACFVGRGLRQLAMGRGERFHQCIINAGIQSGLRK